MFNSRQIIAILAGIFSTGFVCPLQAKNIQVQMKNRGSEGMMVFEPSFVKAEVGDVITFVPTDSSHNAQTIPGLAPKDVPPFKGAMNKPVTLAVTKQGLYGIKCLPHLSMGMVALIQVGKISSSELANARRVKLPPLAAKRMNAAFQKVK